MEKHDERIETPETETPVPPARPEPPEEAHHGLHVRTDLHAGRDRNELVKYEWDWN